MNETDYQKQSAMDESGEHLQHYGVKGMRWGVRRATKKLSKATSDDTKRSAVKTLQKHHAKGSAKIEKLKKKEPKLQAKADKAVVKYDTKAAKLKAKAAKKRKKMGGTFTSTKKAEKLYVKAMRLEAKAQTLTTKSEKAKSKVQANKTMQEAFKREIKNIDSALVKKGRAYING